MPKKIIIGLILLLIIGAIVYRFRNHLVSPTTTTTQPPLVATPAPTIATPSPDPVATLPWPIAGGKDRVTKIPFALFVSPTNSPIYPQRFTGYHTGWDFEITEAELNVDVPIMAVCDGKIVYRSTANGYGGVTVQSCQFQDSPITVLYGHVRLSSVPAIGTTLKTGDRIGLLGNNRSTETDGERKHLHFDIHKGAAVELRGYVQNQSQLKDWIDPTEFFK